MQEIQADLIPLVWCSEKEQVVGSGVGCSIVAVEHLSWS